MTVSFLKKHISSSAIQRYMTLSAWYELIESTRNHTASTAEFQSNAGPIPPIGFPCSKYCLLDAHAIGYVSDIIAIYRDLTLIYSIIGVSFQIFWSSENNYTLSVSVTATVVSTSSKIILGFYSYTRSNSKVKTSLVQQERCLSYMYFKIFWNQ